MNVPVSYDEAIRRYPDHETNIRKAILMCGPGEFLTEVNTETGVLVYRFRGQAGDKILAALDESPELAERVRPHLTVHSVIVAAEPEPDWPE